MRKIYVLDTNVLIHDPDCINKFEDNIVYIPHLVIEELDALKTSKGEKGYNARKSIRNIINLNISSPKKGVETPDGGIIRLHATDWLELAELPTGWDKRKIDNLILLSVKAIEEEVKDVPEEKNLKVVLITNDAAVFVKAKLMNIAVENYKNDRIEKENLYTGRKEIYVSDDIINELIKNKEFGQMEKINETFYPNEYINLKSYTNSSVLCKYKNNKLVKLEENRKTRYVKPVKLGQHFLENALMTDAEECPLTIVVGPAGTGKTLLALACGLEQVIENKKYTKILLCRANITMDEDIGYLPGSEEDKIAPLLRGAYDNLEVMLRNEDDTNKEIEDKITELFQRGYIVAQSLGYLRGRSINNTYIIIDEAQNCTPNQIFSIITRAAPNSKLILLGDPQQIDNARLDKKNNGLVYALEKMKESDLCSVVTFDESECSRSALAKEASSRFKK